MRWSTLLLFITLTSFVAISCSKDDDNDPQPTQITDADGNVYTTVTIGTQTWMVENLKSTKYNDGTPISLLDYGHWGIGQDGAYCNLFDTPSNSDKYGRLYDWYAVNTGKLAPAGWHVPSHAEWQTLLDFVGGADVAGGKLKEVGFTNWSVPNTGATDEFGFAVVPGLWRVHSAQDLAGSGENQYGRSAHFWTATSHASLDDFAHHRTFNYDTEAVFGVTSGDIAGKAIGMSVRLIKD
jgi:uncharacterized protein (TIGR02145 family)